MAQEKSTFDQILKQVDQLAPEERGRLYRHLQFRLCEEQTSLLRQRLNEQRASQALPPAVDDDVHDALDAMRTPADWEALRREIQKGIDSLDRGEGIPAEVVFAELKDRYQRRKAAQ